VFKNIAQIQSLILSKDWSCELSGSSLGALWELSGSSLGALWELVAVAGISPLLYNFILNPLMVASSNPFRRGSRGWGTLVHQNHGAGGGNGSIMVGMFVCLCLVSKKPSEREFFVPVGTDLGVKLLSPLLISW
jgi:hypothetical protein